MNNFCFHLIHALLLGSLALAAQAADFRGSDLKTDYRVNPLGLDRLAPALSWRMDAGGRQGAAQTGYRIVSATTRENLVAGKFSWGIRYETATIATIALTLAPKIPATLDSVKASVETPPGVDRSAWKKDGNGSVTWDITIPANCRTQIVAPVAPENRTQLRVGEKLATLDEAGAMELPPGNYPITWPDKPAGR